MAVEERTFGGENFRPRPEVHLEKNNELLIVATPWGPRASARRAIQIVQDHFLSSRNDRETTSPFAKLGCLSPVGNDLRTAVRLANDTIYNEENKNEFASGIELTVLARHGLEICWVQVGHPYMFLDRSSAPMRPLGNSLDLSTELSTNGQSYPPLPQKLLGLDASSNFEVNSCRIQPDDRIILVSRSSLPTQFYHLDRAHRSLPNITDLLAKANSQMPFWLGLMNF